MIADECKQLSYEKIDDRTTCNTRRKHSKNKIEMNIRICEISRKTRRGKIQETVRRLFDATSVSAIS